MKSYYAAIAIFSLFLIGVSITESRKDLSAGEYWRNVMKDEPMPTAIHGLIAHNSDNSLAQNDKTKCNENHGHPRVTAFVDEFKPILDVTAYPDDDTHNKIGAQNHHHHVISAFTEEFEPIPDVTAYPDHHDDQIKTGKENRDHHYINHVNGFTNKFEPIPDVTAYPDNHHHKTDTTREFEPSPNVSAYNE